LPVVLSDDLVKQLIPESVTYSDIIGRTTGITNLDKDAFKVPQARPVPGKCTFGLNDIVPNNTNSIWF
ncbi:hypothetical protein HDU76_011800, partial [Blyttiomyces sp. JEL0837]